MILEILVKNLARLNLIREFLGAEKYITIVSKKIANFWTKLVKIVIIILTTEGVEFDP
jgi:hypothetical protein